ncbi:MAG TPA: ATP-binding protein [Terrimicrobiaceae bacterium]|nr:ATP-binding protein [Terrimicrobiaceae bacterium]
MISIRRRMTLLVCGGIALLLLVGGLAGYFTIRAVLTAQFDATLAAKAQALIVATELDDEDLEIDLNVREFAGFGSRAGGDFFEVLGPDGRTLEKSPSLGDDRLMEWRDGTTPNYGWLTLPDGRPGRAIWKSFPFKAGEQAKLGILRVIVASYSGGLQQSLRSIVLVLAGIGLGGLILTVFVVHGCLKLGLQPLDELGRQVRDIHASRLHQRLPTASLPRELRPITEKLNEMLERLEAGFERERRFSAYAAHELRTPLTELKAMTELATNWPDEFNRRHGEEMLQAIAENEALLDKLSLLSRTETDGADLQLAPLDLNRAVQSSVERVRGAAAERSLTIHTEVQGDIMMTDPVLWAAIINNLLGNAVRHAPAAARVLVQVSPHQLVVSNEAPNLGPNDIPHLFERFWQKSESRSEKGHSGLGLAIVAACAERLGGRCLTTLAQGRLQIEIAWTA